jgi:hypothetical protein
LVRSPAAPPSKAWQTYTSSRWVGILISWCDRFGL